MMGAMGVAGIVASYVVFGYVGLGNPPFPLGPGQLTKV